MLWLVLVQEQAGRAVAALTSGLACAPSRAAALLSAMSARSRTRTLARSQPQALCGVRPSCDSANSHASCRCRCKA
jgi:hypothetical protein